MLCMRLALYTHLIVGPNIDTDNLNVNLSDGTLDVWRDFTIVCFTRRKRFTSNETLV